MTPRGDPLHKRRRLQFQVPLIGPGRSIHDARVNANAPEGTDVWTWRGRGEIIIRVIATILDCGDGRFRGANDVGSVRIGGTTGRMK